MDNMDKIDKNIIYVLRKDSSRSISQLAKYLGIPRTTLKNRITRLEKQGIIKGYKAVLDWEKIGYPLCNYVHLSITRGGRGGGPTELAASLAKIDNVEEVHEITGRWDIIAKIRMKKITDLTDMLENKQTGLVKIHPAFRTESMLVIKSSKED